MNSLINNMIIGKNELEKYSFDTENENYSFTIDSNSKSTILIYSILKGESSITINVGENSNIKIVYFASGNNSYSLKFNVERDSSLTLFTSDNNKSNSKIVKTINLVGTNSYFKGYEFISSINNIISGGFYVNHLAKDTTADSTLNYLSNNNGYINRDAIATIEKHMDNSSSSENIKGIILSKDSRIDSKPILVISCDDVHASHGCAIGTIDDNEIYYLMSRGLTKEDSLKIICKSLINPILREIKDEEFYELIKPSLFETIGE